MMHGKLRNFGNSIDMTDQLMSAASAPANTVTKEAFAADTRSASEFFRKGDRPRRTEGSSAGYNSSKSAYIEQNRGGYQARSHHNDISIPERTNVFRATEHPSIRMSSYRKNHLRSVTRGLRALS